MDEHPTPYTYDQAATALGIHPEAVRAHLQRNALRRGPPANDGRPTVLLSPVDIATIRASIRPQPPAAASDAAGRPGERDSTIRAQEGEIDALREALARERELTDKAEATATIALAELANERVRAAIALAEAKAAREATARELRQLERAEAALKASETQREAAQVAREATRAELAEWAAGGPLARAWRAFWRGR
jgi:hypothetical protein